LATEAGAFDAASTGFANAGLYHLSAIESEVAERTAGQALRTSIKGVGRLAGGAGVAGRVIGHALTGQEPGWYRAMRATPFLGLGMRIGEFINGCVLEPLGLY